MSLSSIGFLLPYCIAISISSSFIPFPLSRIAINAPSTGKKYISTFVAFAAMLLSIISATAASREYPIALVDSINVGA